MCIRDRDIAGGGAADAAGRGPEITLRTGADQAVIDGHRTEFVDDDGGTTHFRFAQKLVQKRGLARPQEAGKQCDRHRSGGWGDRRDVFWCNRLLPLHSEHIRTFKQQILERLNT